MTYAEVAEEINAYGRRRQAEDRRQEQIRAAMDYQLAQLVGMMVHDPKKFPRSLKKAYPDLFKGASDSWRENKAQWQKYADEFNRRRGKTGK